MLDKDVLLYLDNDVTFFPFQSIKVSFLASKKIFLNGSYK